MSAPPIGKESRETGRSFLIKGEHEKSGFGLYSYVLFGAPPTEATKDRYLSLITAYLAIPDVEALKEYGPTCKMNVTYFPITANPDKEPFAEWLLDHYDFARARSLLQTIAGTHRDGPYIISSYKPLSDVERLSGQYLYQDLSSVPATVISLWVKEFLKQVEQEHFWDERTAMQCVLEIRRVIEAAAIGLPKVQQSVGTVIKWIK